MLLGLTEFTRIYIQIKDNPWPYVNLARLVHNARMGNSEVVELLKIANGFLPRVRLEHDRVNCLLMYWTRKRMNYIGLSLNSNSSYQNFASSM